MKRLNQISLGILVITSVNACGRSPEKAKLNMAPPGVSSHRSSQEHEMRYISNYPNLSTGMAHAFNGQAQIHLEISTDRKNAHLWLPGGESVELNCNGDKNFATKCESARENVSYEFSAPIVHGWGIPPYSSAKLKIYVKTPTNRHGIDTERAHQDSVYGERHLNSQETEAVVHVMRQFAGQSKATGQLISCRNLAANTESQLIKDGWIYPAANESEKVGFLLAANLMGLEGLCEK